MKALLVLTAFFVSQASLASEAASSSQVTPPTDACSIQKVETCALPTGNVRVSPKKQINLSGDQIKSISSKINEYKTLNSQATE